MATHLSAPFEPGPALIAAALATTTIKVGNVFDNDFRHPALLAKVAASIDVLSGGRLEFMIGAGWMKTEYDQIGIPFDPPGVRVGRLEEAVQIIKASGRMARFASPVATTRSPVSTGSLSRFNGHTPGSSSVAAVSAS